MFSGGKMNQLETALSSSSLKEERGMLDDMEQEQKGEKTHGVIFLRGILEIIAGLGIIELVGWFLPQKWGAPHILFCAFFLLIFAIALRHERNVAYSAGLLAAIGYSVLLWQYTRPALLFTNAFFLLEPFSLLLGSILMADLFHAHQQKVQEVEDQHAQTLQTLKGLHERYERAIEQNAALEQQGGVETLPDAVLCEKISQLWKKHGREQDETALDLIISATGAQACAIYYKHGEQMERQALSRKGKSAGGSGSILNTIDPVVKRAMELCQVSTIQDIRQKPDTIPQETVVMAGPLLDREQQIVGMVVIETMPLRKFTSTTINLFSALLHVISVAAQASTPLSHIDTVEIAAAKNALHPEDDTTIRLPSPKKRPVSLAKRR